MPRRFDFVLSVIITFSLSLSAMGQNNGGDYCGFSKFGSGLLKDTQHLAQGFRSAPREAVKPHNLAWELPIAATAGVLIARYDTQAVNRIQSTPLQHLAGRWSNIGLGIELGSAAFAYGYGCGTHRGHMSDAGFKMLDAMGAAVVSAEAVKVMFNRQYPYSSNSRGEFWEGGKSFPSGHAALSFGFASALAHEYPDKKWLKWAAYALATGVSLSRLPAKKHFPSDVLVGGAVGYVVGSYMATR